MEIDDIFPKVQTLEWQCREYQEEIRAEIEAIREIQGDNDFILHSLEDYDARSIGNLKAVGKFLTEKVFLEDERAYQTVIRAMLFANQVASIVHHNLSGYRLVDYVQELYEASDPQQQLDIDVRGYWLSENPSLRNILKYYALDIDQYRGYEHLIESAGGMVFMLVERSLREQWIQEEIRSSTENYFDNAR